MRGLWQGLEASDDLRRSPQISDGEARISGASSPEAPQQTLRALRDVSDALATLLEVDVLPRLPPTSLPLPAWVCSGRMSTLEGS